MQKEGAAWNVKQFFKFEGGIHWHGINVTAL